MRTKSLCCVAMKPCLSDRKSQQLLLNSILWFVSCRTHNAKVTVHEIERFIASTSGLVVLRKYKTTPTQSECERNQKLTNTSSIVAHLLEANGNSVGTEATTAHIQVVLADDGTVVAASTAADANQHKPRPGIIPPKFASHTIA
jgi:hypothetical protein